MKILNFFKNAFGFKNPTQIDNKEKINDVPC